MQDSFIGRMSGLQPEEECSIHLSCTNYNIMKRPKAIKPKSWQLHLKIAEMNKKIVKEKMKNPLYILDEIDKIILKQK